MVSGTLTASFPFPMKFSRDWRWENTWLIYATLALVLIPVMLAKWADPHLLALYLSLPWKVLLLPLVLGFGWGLAQVTFGLSIAQVGVAMAFAIVIGLSALLGSLIPLAVFHPDALSDRPGAVLMASAVLLIVGLTFYANAGHLRDRAATSSDSTGRSFRIGLLLCVFTGCFGSMINLGFVSGGRIADQAVRLGISAQRATFCIWALVLVAGYLPNLAYTLYLLRRNRTLSLFAAGSLRETLLALAAAALWYFGMIGYGIGADVMGAYGDSIGFAACMTVLLLWSSAIGVFTGEWHAASSRARSHMHLGLAFITASMLVLGLGSLL